ncbi:MAG: VWA domain-containing protein [Planctomycetota bacterium]|nr:VWA domain-containing protein [Planctomycetota bacterium]
MSNALIAFFAGILFIAGTTNTNIAQLGKLPGKQEEFIQKLGQAEAAVRSLSDQLERQKTVVKQETAKLKDARSQVELAEKEVRIRAAQLGSIKFGNSERERHLSRIFNRYNDKIKKLEDQHNEGKFNASQKQQILNQLRSLSTQRSQVQRQINRVKRETHLAQRKRDAESKLLQATKNLEQAKRKLPAPQIKLDRAVKILENLKNSFQTAIDNLANLRLTAGEELKDLAPPFLERVRILSADKSRTFYEAKWKPEQDRVQQAIVFLNKLIEGHKQDLKKLARERLDLAERQKRLTEEWSRLNDQYRDLIGVEMWENILVEIGATTASVLWNEKGTIAGNLFIESALKSKDFWLGNNRPSFDLSHELPAVPFNNRAEHSPKPNVLSVDEDQAFQALLSAFFSEYVKDKGIEDSYQEIKDFIQEKGYSWTNEKLRDRVLSKKTGNLLANIKLKDQLNSLAFENGNPNQISTQLDFKKLADDTFINISKGVAVNVAKQWLRDHLFTSRGERLKIYKIMFEYDLRLRAIAMDYNYAIKRTRRTEARLTALNLQREQLLAALDTAKNKRFLHVIKDEIVETPDNRAIAELTFSVAVREITLKISNFPLNSTSNGKVIETEFSMDDLPDVAELSVSAIHAYSFKELDTNPATIARFHTQSKNWTGFEQGDDKKHRVRLRPLGDGVSVAFLFDCSRSMRDKNKLAEAKTAAKRILQDKSLFAGKNNEVALWVFVDGSPQLVEEFTNDTNAVASAIDSLSANGGTPLAKSILAAGDYLARESKFKRKALIVLSDGEDTENGNPQYAIQLIKEKSANVQRKGW